MAARSILRGASGACRGSAAAVRRSSPSPFQPPLTPKLAFWNARRAHATAQRAAGVVGQSSVWHPFSRNTGLYFALGAACGAGAHMVFADAAVLETVPVDVIGDAFQIEPESGTKFPSRLANGEELVAAGVRLMTPLKVQVYAIGLYGDYHADTNTLAEWKGKSSDDLLTDSAFWSRLSSHEWNARRTLRLQVIRDVDGKHMQNGFDRGLVPRCRHAMKKMNMPGGKEALRKFNAVFHNAGLLKEGTEILIHFGGAGKLSLEIAGDPKIELDSDALVWAFLDMFLGDKCVAPNVKGRIAEGFSKLLAS